MRRACLLCLTSVTMLAMCLALPASPAGAAQVTVPVDVGVGPAYYYGPGPLFEGTNGHYGLKISVAAIIDRKTLEQNINKVPKQYRSMIKRTGEIRYGPSIFIPDSLIISPKLDGTGMYGVTWRPIGLNIGLIKEPVRLDLGAGLLLTAAFIHSDTMADSPTIFVRPGLDLGLRLEIPFTDNFLMSMGAFAQAYVPQEVGGFGLPDTSKPAWLDESIWLLPQAFVMLHYRFPYTVNL